MSEGRDIGWAVADGVTKPIREVIAERKRDQKAIGLARIAAARRMRAGMIGLLESCTCDYPLVKYATASEHHESCVAHTTWQSMQRANDARPQT